MPALRDFDAAAFLRDTWQKRPLLIRNAFTDWSNPLEPDELAGLACEAEVESRLVRQPGPGEWELEHGPIAATRFGELGGSPWTLLLQAVDHHVPEVAALIEPFRFIPDWRIDDVMVSYAVAGGGVGPHFDQYDVFLVQGLGRRRWRVGPRCDDTAPLLPHDGLRLLAEFEAHEEWVLEPGDVLYVPPGFAHDGVAVEDDCMTYSVGFRAPSRGDLVSAWADHVIDTLGEDDRYTDPDLSADAHPGEISATALARLQDMALGALADRAAFASWFGRYVTQPKDDRLDWAPDEQMTAADLAGGGAGVTLDRNPASRFSFVRQAGEAVTLFVDGASYHCHGPAAAFAERLCAGPCFVAEAEDLAPPEIVHLIADLVNRGALAVSDPD
ncbi:50S ribosomal protein L16 arginine hydroxylase [Tsuneonella dongtanensis]|uniref:50S ribosomal protein L16 arginine hydroxylase n=1 Tax=Tsuneonella dongtanensis TaxID=692370 RepID=A0A1B2AGY1_9SPHN|nr:cupin domain-containing protein [Tsuneonella dongtanensis]ANY21400.1 50S ribosomal protein L16 arginine hydroxylase [Tsuneonella dongtanensis]